ncbi:hypothetical protein [Poseidonibacter sp.]|uniref:hypothetical protein n=1 Tax=Poseidonibacter sp. TaxID=2321188 RepID=UPI003C77E9FC
MKLTKFLPNLLNDLKYQINQILIINTLKNFKEEILDTLIFPLNNNCKINNEDQIKNILENSVKDTLNKLTLLNILNEKKYADSYLVLKEIIDTKIENIFLILGFLYQNNLLSQVISNYKSKNINLRAYSIDLIDNIVSNDIKRVFLQLLDDISIEKRLVHFLKIL